MIREIGGVPPAVCVCTFLVMVLDGFDVQLIGFAAPSLIAAFGIERSALGIALAASVVGMCIGAVAIGPFGDVCGRRPALLLSTAVFGATTLLASMATSIEELALWRFATGIGLGAALPGAVALMAEFTPARYRSQLVIWALLGVPVGGIVGSALAAEIVPAVGWRVLFAIGGALPLLAAAVLFVVLPESPRFVGRPTRAPAGGPGAGWRAVFQRVHVWDTTALTIAFFANMFAVYAFFSWLPVVLTSLEMPLDQAVRSLLVFNLAGVGGSLLNAWLISRRGSRTPLAAVAGIAMLSIGLLALITGGSAPGTSATFAIIAGAGFGIHALQTGLYLVSANVFPAECRTSGVGLASGAGRLGGILSSLTGGILLAGGAAPGFFAGVALALGVSLACVLVMRRHVVA